MGFGISAAMPQESTHPDKPREDSKTAAWTLVIHGGAGTISKTMPAEQREACLASLRTALSAGVKILDEGGAALDAVEQVVRILEDDPKFNAGKGAVYDAAGGHSLDAAVMDGRTLAGGAVAGVRTVRNPVSLARLVMEKTKHVLLIGDGAETFADEMKVERVDPKWFDTEARYKQWRKVVEDETQRPQREAENADPVPERDAHGTGQGKHGTVGAVARDSHGNLAAATSTGGLTNKKFGRVGDTPILGAGTYADDRTCAVSGTGIGEEYIRHAVGHAVSARMELAKQTLDQAARSVVFETLKPGDGGLIAVDHDGNAVLLFNTEGMYRGVVDSTGKSEVAIW